MKRHTDASISRQAAELCHRESCERGHYNLGCREHLFVTVRREMERLDREIERRDRQVAELQDRIRRRSGA